MFALLVCCCLGAGCCVGVCARFVYCLLFTFAVWCLGLFVAACMFCLVLLGLFGLFVIFFV